MQIQLMSPKVRDLVPGFIDDEAKGCFAMGGQLCCRPAYQRAFCYDDVKRNKVIDSVRKGLPLNVMYWMRNAAGGYELMDGQQRTLSLLQYCSGQYSIDYQYFHNLSQTEQDKILDYELMVYVCDGTDDERLEWFKTVNIAGEKLTAQELLNACYSGPWCQDAKKYFSKPGGPAAQVGDKYLKGSAIRQDYLETALTWICDRDGIAIPEYMAQHQNDATAYELWNYFRAVIDWVESLFGKNYRKKLMQGLPWGLYYNSYGPCMPGRPVFDPDVLEQRISELEQDEDITNQRGIYEYVLGGECDEKLLHIRVFSDKDKRRKMVEQGCKCAKCGCDVTFETCEADHITPWSAGGHTSYDNLQILCKKCNRTKSDK